jgi:hypothetical protein
MAKKLRIAILFNEPVAGGADVRNYITETGQLHEGPSIVTRKPGRGLTHEKIAEIVPNVDLSEVGVMEEMQDIKEALDTLGYKTTIFNVDSDIIRLIEYPACKNRT